MAREDKRSWGAVVGDGALTVVAVLGAVCIALVIAAALFDVRIILFSTGSMSPTIPAGSAAVVRHIPAADIAVGDVVTVDRPGKLPITHRVTTSFTWERSMTYPVRSSSGPRTETSRM